MLNAATFQILRTLPDILEFRALTQYYYYLYLLRTRPFHAATRPRPCPKLDNPASTYCGTYISTNTADSLHTDILLVNFPQQKGCGCPCCSVPVSGYICCFKTSGEILESFLILFPNLLYTAASDGPYCCMICRNKIDYQIFFLSSGLQNGRVSTRGYVL